MPFVQSVFHFAVAPSGCWCGCPPPQRLEQPPPVQQGWGAPCVPPPSPLASVSGCSRCSTFALACAAVAVTAVLPFCVASAPSSLRSDFRGWLFPCLCLFPAATGRTSSPLCGRGKGCPLWCTSFAGDFGVRLFPLLCLGCGSDLVWAEADFVEVGPSLASARSWSSVPVRGLFSHLLSLVCERWPTVPL